MVYIVRTATHLLYWKDLERGCMGLTRKEFFKLYGELLKGAFSNPTTGATLWDSYDRQQLMQGLAADLQIISDLLPLPVDDES